MAKKLTESKHPLFPALLKYWRGSRGLSQLDLALAADVSARHISFMETGRASPSKAMVLTLGNTLQIPLREQNALLQAAGFEPQFHDPGFTASFDGPLGFVMQQMLDKHEPYPMTILDWGYDLLRSNQGGSLMLSLFTGSNDPEQSINIFEMVFDPELARPFIKDWEAIAHTLLCRLHREALLKSHDERLNRLIEKVLRYPDVPKDWRHPDFSQSNEPFLTVNMSKDGLELSFVTMMTAFNAPQNITTEELLIESYFPANEATRRFFEELA